MADIFIPQNSAFRSTLPTGTNLDNVKDKGVYSLSSNNTYTNSPVAYGTLEVISGSQENTTFLLQRATSGIGAWSRLFTGQEWRDWYQESGQIPSPTYSNGILHYALNVAPNGTTIVSQRNMGTSDLPNSAYLYGSAIILKRGANALSVILTTDGNTLPIVSNTHTSDVWQGWKYSGNIPITTVNDFYAYVLSTPANSTTPVQLYGTVVSGLFPSIGNYAGYGHFCKFGDTQADLTFMSNNQLYQSRFNPTAKTITTFEKYDHYISVLNKTASTATFAVPSSSVCILIHSSTTKAYSGIWHITCNSSGGITVTDLFSTALPHENVTVAKSTNTMVFTFSSSISQNWMIVNLRGADSIALS